MDTTLAVISNDISLGTIFSLAVAFVAVIFSGIGLKRTEVKGRMDDMRSDLTDMRSEVKECNEDRVALHKKVDELENKNHRLMSRVLDLEEKGRNIP